MIQSALPCDVYSHAMPGVIAVIGCDGTGKSTLTADLLARLGTKHRIVRRYLGLVSGETGNKIKRLPWIGVRLERYLAAKARRAQDMRKKLPGVPTAIVMYLLSHYRAWQLRRVARLAQSGVLVITDRFPQAEIPGFNYDGPGIDARRSNNRFVRWLAAREQALYERMSEYRPALVIRLNIDADTAHARKPDHSLSELRDKSQIMPRLRFNGARILDLDSRAPYPQVLGAALVAIDNAVGQRAAA